MRNGPKPGAGKTHAPGAVVIETLLAYVRIRPPTTRERRVMINGPPGSWGELLFFSSPNRALSLQHTLLEHDNLWLSRPFLNLVFKLRKVANTS